MLERKFNLFLVEENTNFAKFHTVFCTTYDRPSQYKMSMSPSFFRKDVCVKEKSKSSPLKKLFSGKSKTSRDSIDNCEKTFERSISQSSCSSNSSDELDNKLSLLSLNTKSSKSSQTTTSSKSSAASKKSKLSYNVDRFCGPRQDETSLRTHNNVWQQAFMYSGR